MEIREQNDICEFYALFIDKLNAALSFSLTVPSKEEFYINNNELYNMNSSFGRMAFKADYEWIKHNAREWSNLLNVIYGQTVSQIECGACKKIYHNYEMFNSLSLSITENQDLQAAITDHFADHTVNAATNTHGQSDMWKCDHCKNKSESTQSSSIWRLPPVLVISLKRFDHSGHSIKKNNSHVNIPTTLDLTPYVLDRSHSTTYKLKSIGFHMGSYYGGHYFAVIIDWKYDKVYHVDDDCVRSIPMEDVEKNAGYGYVYFYERT
jgi:ubiquitin C-terminal hydrolase